MTSLGSVCREKINAAATQLGVDTEIVRVTDHCKEEKIANCKLQKKKKRFGLECVAKCLLYFGRTAMFDFLLSLDINVFKITSLVKVRFFKY